MDSDKFLERLDNKLDTIATTVTETHTNVATLTAQFNQHVKDDAEFQKETRLRLRWVEGIIKWGTGAVTAVMAVIGLVYKLFGGNQ